MSKFKNHYNSDRFPDEGEINIMPSKTIPDQSLSIPDILKRYAQGLSFNGVQVGEYDEENPDLPDFKKMDLSEIDEFRKYAAAKVKEAQDNVTKQMEERKKNDTIEMYKRWKEEEAKKNPDDDKGSANSPVI